MSGKMAKKNPLTLIFNKLGGNFVIRLGFEPKTHSLEGCCSIQLSYQTIIFRLQRYGFFSMCESTFCKKMHIVGFNLHSSEQKSDVGVWVSPVFLVWVLAPSEDAIS